MFKPYMKAVFWVLLYAFAMLISSCIPMQPEGPPPTPAENYLTARMVFNGLLEDYVTQKRIADDETKDRWTRKVDPWFERGAVALNAWGSALKAGDSPESSMQAYLEIKNQLMAIVIQELTATQ